MSSSISKFSIRIFSTRRGIDGFDLQQRRRPEPQLPEAAVDRLEQVVGAVLLNLDVAVADDAEQVRVDDVDVREQLAEVDADDVFEKREGRARRSTAPG